MSARSPDKRKRELGRIHILKAQLGLDDETYRGVLWAQFTVDSAAKLDDHGRDQVIKHLEALLAKSGRKIEKRPHNVSTRSRGELKKIEALLADAGKPWTYAIAMARHMYQKQRLEFCSPGELAGIITALERQALKRLKDQLGLELQRLHLDWNFAAVAAALLFGFDASRRDLQKYTEVMSNTLRWLRGDIAPVCSRPVDLEQPQCCSGCYRVTEIQAGRG